MDRPFTAVLLAGTLRPTPLRQALDIPALCLPVGGAGTLLEAWRRRLGEIGVGAVRIAVNSDHDAVTVMNGAGPIADPPGDGIRAVAEPSAWRGAGGILRDVAGDAPEGVPVLAAEANALPPEDLGPLVEAMSGWPAGVVGTYVDDQPAGVYLFSRELLGRIPPIGYHDLKEQFLPMLASGGVEIGAARIPGEPTSLRDCAGYLAAVRLGLGGAGDDPRCCRVSAGAKVSTSAVVEDGCIVEAEAVIEDGAVVHQSVVLRGAVVQRGAVVSRSVVGPGARVTVDRRVIRDVVFDAEAYRGARDRAAAPGETAVAGGERR